MVELPDGETTNLKPTAAEATRDALKIIDSRRAKKTKDENYQRIAEKIKKSEQLNQGDIDAIGFNGGRYKTIPYSKFSYVMRERLGFPQKELKDSVRAAISVRHTPLGGSIEDINPAEGIRLYQENILQKESPASVSTESNPASAKSSANQNPIKAETRASTGPETESASANQETVKPSPALESLFADLDSPTVRKANKAKKAAKLHPQAAEIDYVQNNYHDILIQLMDAGKLEVNGSKSVTEENKSCL